MSSPDNSGVDDDAPDMTDEPNYAVICSFFNKFAVVLGIRPMPFIKLRSLLMNYADDGRVDRELIDLHVKLMRLVGLTSASAGKWLVYLQKFCSFDPYLSDEMTNLNRYGYGHSPVQTKLNILKSLCEKQFDFNLKFKETLGNVMNAAELRLAPLGADALGQVYWYQVDGDVTVRVYSEESDDQCGATWSLRVSDRQQLATLIEQLDTPDGAAGTSADDVKPDVVNGGDTLPLMTVTNSEHTFIDTFQANIPEPKPNSKAARQKRVEDVKKEAAAAPAAAASSSDEAKPSAADPADVLPERSTRARIYSPVASVPKKSADSSKTKQKTKKSKHDSNSSSSSDEVDTTDSEFIPLATLKKRLSNDHRRRAIESEVDTAESDGDDGDGEEAKKERKQANQETLCKKCNKSDHWEVLLLCDSCDDAWHTWCLRPPLWYVPDGDWFCPVCQQRALVVRLRAAIGQLDRQLAVKAADDKKKKQAADRMKRELEYIGVSLANIIPNEQVDKREQPSDDSDDEDASVRRHKKTKRPAVPAVPIAIGRSRRRCIAQIDYNFKEFDDLIEEAVDEINEAPAKPKYHDPSRPQGGAGRGKDIANIIKHAERMRAGSKEDTSNAAAAKKKKEYSDDDTEDDADQDESKNDATPIEPTDDKKIEVTRAVGQPPRSILTKKPRRRLNDLDLDNATESEASEYKADSDKSASIATPSDDEEEYMTDDSERKASRRRSQRLRTVDKAFVVSGSEDSDYEPRRSTRTRGRRKASTEDEESEDSLVARARRKRSKYAESDTPESDASFRPSKKKHKGSSSRPPARPARKRTPRGRNKSDADDDYERPVKKSTRSKLAKMVKKVGGGSEDESAEDESKPASDRNDDDDDGAGDSQTEPNKSKHTTIPNLARPKRAKIISSGDDDENEHEQQLKAKPDNTKANSNSVSRNLDTHDNNESSFMTVPQGAPYSTASAGPGGAAECASAPTMVSAAYTPLYSATAYVAPTYQPNGMTPPPPPYEHVTVTPQSSLGNVLSAAILEHNDLTQL